MENKYYFIIGGSVVALLLIVGLVLAFRGTGTGGQPSTNAPVTITIWRLFDNQDALQSIFTDYQSEHKNVTIKYEKKNPADYESVFANAIADGKGPDIISLPNDWLVKHKDKLVPAPDTLETVDQFKQQFVDVVGSDAVIDNKIYGMPLYADALALYYNSDLMVAALNRLRQANPNADLQTESRLLTHPPATWDDLVSAVKLIKQQTGNDITMTGLAMGTADTTEGAAAILQSLMLQNGAEMTNVDRSAASFQLPDKTQTGTSFFPGTQALDFYTAFAKSDHSVYNWNSRLGDSLDAFINQKAAMMVNFQFVQSDLKQRAPTLTYDVAPLPQISGSTTAADVASYMIETVTKNSAHPDVAWDLIKFMTDQSEASAYRTATRRPSALRAENEGNTDAFPAGITAAKSIYKPDAAKYDGYFLDMIRAVVELNQPPQTAIEVAANKITQLLLGQSP